MLNDEHKLRVDPLVLMTKDDLKTRQIEGA